MSEPYPAYPSSAPPPLRCPLCGGDQFQHEQSRQQSLWGLTSHQMTLMICQRCRYVLHFYDRHSIFDLN